MAQLAKREEKERKRRKRKKKHRDSGGRKGRSGQAFPLICIFLCYFRWGGRFGVFSIYKTCMCMYVFMYVLLPSERVRGHARCLRVKLRIPVRKGRRRKGGRRECGWRRRYSRMQMGHSWDQLKRLESRLSLP